MAPQVEFARRGADIQTRASLPLSFVCPPFLAPISAVLNRESESERERERERDVAEQWH
jgi:hypothetical protein